MSSGLAVPALRYLAMRSYKCIYIYTYVSYLSTYPPRSEPTKNWVLGVLTGVLGVLTPPPIRPALGARALANFMAKYIVRWDANAFLLDR